MLKTYQSTVEGNAPIYFGEDARELLIEQVQALNPDRVYIVTDRTVEALHIDTIRENLPFAIPSELVVFNEGEENKNLGMLQHVAGDLYRAGVTDRSLVLNVGGGVVLNLGGLAASLLCRGVRFAHVATTLMAQTQVITSNRQLMNFVGEKNVIGLYRAPAFSIADPFFLETESDRQIRAAIVDFARQALVLGGAYYKQTLAAVSATGFDKLPALGATAEKALLQSLEITKGDPKEERAAALEYYGNTLGRALEALAEGRLLPGEARFYGMRVAGLLAKNLRIMSDEEFRKHEDLLARIQPETAFPATVRTDRLVFALHGNNKTQLGSVDFMLLEAIGRVAGGGELGSRVSVPDTEIAHAIDKVRSHAVL